MPAWQGPYAHVGLQGKLFLGYSWQGHLPHIPVPTLELSLRAFQ